MLQLTTGDTKFGPNRGKVQSFLTLRVQVKKDKWTTYVGIGYRINLGADNKNSLFLGGTALYQVTYDLQLGGEVFHESPNIIDGIDSTGFNLGGSYVLIHDYNLLVAAGKGIKNVSSTNQLSAYLALQVLY